MSKSTMNAGKNSIGTRIRQYRKMRKLSLNELGAATAISPSTLSKIENDIISPGFDKVLRICKGLGLDISDLQNSGSEAAAPSGATPAIPLTRQSVTRRGEGKQFNTSASYSNEYLCSSISRKGMIPSILTLKLTPEDTADPGYVMSRHPGEEYIFVLEGKVIIMLEHYEPIHLEEGDSLYFDSTMGHLYLREGKDVARILSVNLAHEEAA